MKNNIIINILILILILQIIILILRDDKISSKEDFYSEFNAFIQQKNIERNSFRTDFNFYYYKNDIPKYNRETIYNIYATITENCFFDNSYKFTLFYMDLVDESDLLRKVEKCKKQNYLKNIDFEVVDISKKNFLFTISK